jgi:hypothetical protein
MKGLVWLAPFLPPERNAAHLSLGRHQNGQPGAQLRIPEQIFGWDGWGWQG